MSDGRGDDGARRATLARLLARPGADFLLGGLILVSVGLTVIDRSSAHASVTIEAAAHAISLVFAVELALRYRVARSPASFFREYAVDVVSVVPVLSAVLFVKEGLSPGAVTGWVGALSLLRILRLARLLKILRQRSLVFSSSMRRGAREVMFASGLVLLTVVFASAALVTFERDDNPAIRTFGQAFWFSVYSVVAAEPIPNPPVTFGGHVVAVAVILTGLLFFATVIGTVSAVVTDRLRGGEIFVDWQDLRDHLIICGYGRSAEIVAEEYVSAYPDDESPIVLIAELEKPPSFSHPQVARRLQFLNEDFTKIEVLEKAGVKRAARCILLSDTSKGRLDRDADARTVLAALTIERMNPKVYTCAEINHREHAHHLKMGGVNDFVVAGEHNAFLLAQSVVTRGVMSVFSELFTHAHGNRFARATAPSRWKGKRFSEVLAPLKEEHDALLVAVQAGAELSINPADYVFEGGEDVVLICSRRVEL